MRYILALDQGTTSSRSILFDERGEPVAIAQREFEQHYPEPGWVEHDLGEIWSTQSATVAEVLAKAGARAADVAAVGITNQRETACAWDRATGRPLCRAIVWQDRRTAAFCDRLREGGHAERIAAKTGLVIDAYFSASKFRWMLDHCPGLRERAERGEACLGTVDSYLVHRLTDGRVFATDVTNASRTQLWNIRTQDWDEELLELFGVPRAALPEVRGNSEVYGEVSGDVLARPAPIAGIAGDQQAATFGQACHRRGMVKNTYGTGCFMLMHTGTEAAASANRLLTTAAWRLGGGGMEYALEGSVFVAGAVVQWLRDGLGIIRRSSEVERLARSVEDNGGVYLVPAFVGLGAPHWDQGARGTMVGLTRGTTAGHVARAAIEGIAYQVADVLDCMRRDAGEEIPELRVDGGAAANDLMMQFQADILRCPVVRPKVTETTALGAAFLAGLAVGFWESREQIAELWREERRFEPEMDAGRAAELRGRWSEAVERAKGWVGGVSGRG